MKKLSQRVFPFLAGNTVKYGSVMTYLFRKDGKEIFWDRRGKGTCRHQPDYA